MSLALTLVSSILLPLSLPNEFLPEGATLPGLVSLVPIFLAVYRSRSPREASLNGLLFGVVSTLIGSYWLAFFGEFSLWTIGGVTLVYAVYNYVLFGILFVFITGRSDTTLRPVWIAIVWTAYEYLKSVGFLGYPWGLIAYPLARVDLFAQLAEMTGVWGLSFLAAYFNASIAELTIAREPRTGLRVTPTGGRAGAYIFRTVWRNLAAVLLILVTVGAFGAWRLRTLTPRDQISLLLVQQNVDSWRPGAFPAALRHAQELTLEALREAESPIDGVVWSETSLRRPYMERSTYYGSLPEYLPFTNFLEKIGVPLITGAPIPARTLGIPDGGAANGAILLSPEGQLYGGYAKQQLVPFAERLPFRRNGAAAAFLEKSLGLGPTWVPGRRSQTLTMPLSTGKKIRLGTPICFEDSFGWVSREMVADGADLLVNLTNNSWSRQESAQIQHFAASRLRTVELRTTLVRSTNSGLSAVIDAAGRVSQEFPMFEPAAGVVTVPLYGNLWTLYKQFGDWLGYGAVALSFLGLVFRHRARKR